MDQNELQSIDTLTKSVNNGTIYRADSQDSELWQVVIATHDLDEGDRETYPALAQISDPGALHIHYLSFGVVANEGDESSYKPRFTLVVDCFQFSMICKQAAEAQVPGIDLIADMLGIRFPKGKFFPDGI